MNTWSTCFVPNPSVRNLGTRPVLEQLCDRLARPGARQIMVAVNNSRDHFLGMRKKTVLNLGLLLLCAGKVFVLDFHFYNLRRIICLCLV